MYRQLKQTALCLQLRGILLRSHDTFGRITDGPSRDVLRRVLVGVCRVRAYGTDKAGLLWTVRPFTMATTTGYPSIA